MAEPPLSGIIIHDRDVTYLNELTVHGALHQRVARITVGVPGFPEVIDDNSNQTY